MIMIKNIQLNNKHTIPQIGLGTWRLNGDSLAVALPSAIDLGYRHIDTALVYENEKEIGDILSELLKNQKLKRQELFITSKLWNTYHNEPEKALRKTLSDLQVDYLDLYIIHWPVHFKPDEHYNQIRKNGEIVMNKFEIEKVWKQMESFVDQGLVRSIGFSNFGIENISKILSFCRIKPAVCQFEMHPYLQQKELIHFCKGNDIAVTSYSSLGSQPQNKGEPNLREDPIIKEIAQKYNCTVPQIILNWVLDKDLIIIPKSSNPERLKENLKRINLKEEDTKKIDGISINYRYVDIPTFGPNRFK